MNGEIIISGTGVISALGLNYEENLASLLQQRSGIRCVEILHRGKTAGFVAGEVRLTNGMLAELAGFPEASGLPRSALLALCAVKEAAAAAGLSKGALEKCGIILGNTVGGMDLTEQYYHKQPLNPVFIQSHSCGFITEQVAEYLGIKGFVTTISTACSSGANAIMLGARLIRQGLFDRVIAGGADALSMFTYHGFSTLLVVDKENCRPFDRDRKGMNLGEGAGVVVLEKNSTARQGGAGTLALLSGYANANDAYHPTATSPDGNGPFLSMTKALGRAGINAGEVSYINVHGTGTENNDITEAAAMKRVFGQEIPPFSSTKSATGHTLGAAGGIEAVFSVMAIREQVIFPNLFFRTPMEEGAPVPVTRVLAGRSVRHVLSNSFGFGGNNTSLVFSEA